MTKKKIVEKLIFNVRAFLNHSSAKDAHGIAFLPYDNMIRLLAEYDAQTRKSEAKVPHKGYK